MLRRIFLLLATIWLCDLYGQTTITFKLNMGPLIDKKLFSPDLGEKIFVRGNFNRWQNDNFELYRDNGGNIFKGTFKFDATIGDTLEYKFLIQKSAGQIYWESRPNPENPNYGNRILVINDTQMSVPVAIFNYDEFIQYPFIFSKEKLQEDFVEMRKAVEENHPALYDYTDKNTLDSLFDHSYLRINQPLDFNEFYKTGSAVLARIGCGHTKFWIPNDYWHTVPEKLFPLKLQFSGSKVFVGDFYSSSEQIPLGSEIISLNGLTLPKIIETLASITSSDGFIRAFKLKSVERNFAGKYALYYGYPETFKVRYRVPGESEIKEIDLVPVDYETINKFPVRGDELSLKILENNKTALLTINTFIYYDQLEMFKSFIDSSFQVIRNEKIKNLIIDLRGNDGGDPFCSSYLLSYIESEPVRYFAEPYDRYTDLAKPIPLADNNFQGNLYTLIDGNIFSTSGHFCGLLKYHHISKLVGTETGATYTCTGSVEYINLKHTRLILATARKRRYTAAVQNMDPTSGIQPDYWVEQTQSDIIAHKDTVLDFVLELIKKD